MVTFLTLFLGLLVGSHEVRVAAGDEVARIELLLDGASVATLSAPGWSAECDFGEELRPHLLEAVAYDAAGAEVGRAVQRVNLPRDRIEAGIALELAVDGRPSSARVFWQSLEERHPVAARVTFDGRQLAETSPGRFALPDHDERTLHVLIAELRFDDGEVTRVEAAVGGELGDDLTVDMTAIPVTRSARQQPPTADAMRGKLLKGRRPLPVLAVEEGGAELVVVVEQSARRIVGGLGRFLAQNPQVIPRSTGLASGETVRFLSAVAAREASDEHPVELFPISPPFTAEDGGLPYLISHANLYEPGAPQRLADAVAAAAVRAAAGNRPRALLLILGSSWRDRSRFTPDEVRRFLEHLRVPLVVWSTGGERRLPILENRRPTIRKTEWGRAADVSGVTQYLAAVSELRTTLNAQSIVWVGGSHLPHEVTLAAKRSYRLAR